MGQSEFSRFDPAAYLNDVDDLAEYLLEAVNTSDDHSSTAQALSTLTRAPALHELAELMGVVPADVRASLEGDVTVAELWAVASALGLQLRLHRRNSPYEPGDA